MGMWKRVTEKAKQTLGVKVNAADWKPTSNARNLAMIEEVKRFSKHLKVLHKELLEMEGRIESNFGVLKAVLSSPMPQAFVNDENGGAVVVGRDSTTIVGSGVAFEVLHMTASDLKRKLQEEVLKPLDEWQAIYKQIKIRNLKCEELRLELDAKRREAAAMAVALDRQKTIAAAKGDKIAAGQVTGVSLQMTGESRMQVSGVAAGVTGRPASKWEDADFRLQKEEDKVTRLSQRYGQIEYEVYSALVTLIQDTAVLRQYAATAMLVYQNAFAQVYTAFGPLPPPEPVTTPGPEFSEPCVEPTSEKAESSDCQEPQGGGSFSGQEVDNKTGPDTPDVPPGQPSPPAWYAEARLQATPMRYDSDDDS